MDELEAPLAKRRFSAVSAADIASTCNAKVPEATNTATCYWLKVFTFFWEESGLVIDLASCSPSDLDSILGRFYLGVSNKNGEYYKRSACLAATSL